jgi:hypothetical protein
MAKDLSRFGGLDVDAFGRKAGAQVEKEEKIRCSMVLKSAFLVDFGVNKQR